MLVQEHIAHLLMPQVPPGWDDEMRNFFNSQRSEEGPLQTGLITTETNEELDLVDEAAPSHEDDGDEDDSEEEETVDEQTPPSHGDFSEREVNHSSEPFCDLHQLTTHLYARLARTGFYGLR